MTQDGFDWFRDPDVVIQPVLGLAIYINSRGEVCLRQQADISDEDDAYIAFPASEAFKVVDRIQALLASADHG